MTSSPSSAASVALGSPRPRVHHVPDYVTSSGDEAIELAALAGLALDDWQQFVLRHSLGERTDGKWAAKTVGLVVGRQNGKGSVLEARELIGLFLLGEKMLIHTAHLQKTASNHFERVLQLITGVPEFDRRVMSVSRGKGSEAIKLRGGQTIFFMTRARGNTRGLTVDLMVFDEAMFLSEIERNGMVPTMAAQSMEGNTQSWYVGSAVDQQDGSQDGIPFAQVRESGQAGVDGVAFFEWSAPGDDPSRVPAHVAGDPGMWALANPGLGIRISHEWVEHERTVEMGPRGFAVERLGIGDWPDTSGEGDRPIGSVLWADRAEHDPSNRITSRQTFAIDTNLDQTWASIGVAGQRDDGRWQVHVVKHDRGKDWILERDKESGEAVAFRGLAVALHREHPGAPFAMDPRGPAANLISDLRDAGINVIETSTQDYGDACADFLAAVVEDRLRYPAPAPELTDSVADARTQTMGDRWKWSRKNSTSADISPLVAATLALWGSRQDGGVPTVWNLNEIAAQLDGETVEKPDEPTPEPTQGQTFIPLDQAPAHRGLFRP